MTTLLGPSWIGNPESEGKSQILIGDLNSIGQSAAYRQVARRMKDVQLQTGAKARATFPSRFPLMRLDHILVSDDIEVLDAQVIADPRARIASDHLPLMATVRL